MANSKALCALIISAMPMECMRRMLYRACFGYRIAKEAKIGFMSMIAVDSAEIGAANIGMFNRFIGPFHLKIGTGVIIGKSNVISCGAWAVEKQFAEEGYARTCVIGDGCRITSDHFIDSTGGFYLGDHSWVAGSHSQFWTHGIGVRNRHISIESNCYIGSASRFAPGSSIGRDNMVGLGSVVVGSHRVEGALIAGVPAHVLDANYQWRTRNLSSTEARATNTDGALVH
ncbi:MAG: hypothetical protein QM706_08585 [Nitrospira sp.]